MIIFNNMKFKLTKATKIAGVIFLIGLFVALFVNYNSNKIMSTYQENMPYISLGDNIKNKTTKGHLWFEEYMAGDDGNDFQKDIILNFTSSKDIIQKAIDGGETEIGTFNKCLEPELLTLFSKTIIDLENLILFTNKRNDNKLRQAALANDSSNVKIDTGEEAGGKLDQDFDAAYELIQVDMDNVIKFIDAKVESEEAKLNLFNFVILIGTILLFLFISFFIYKNQSETEKITIENINKFAIESNRLEKMAEFVSTISTGNFSCHLDTGVEDDHMAVSLNTMKETLKATAEEDRKRNWATMGIADLGEILRKNDVNEADLYNSIVAFIVKYINANQAGLFIVETDSTTDEPILELKSCYAYNRKKFQEKRIEIGDGLIGQCYLEQETILLTDIPSGYITITSGLGDATPTVLIIVPLKINDTIYGILEIASFTNFEKYHIDFIEKVAESVGSVISNVKVNQRTRKLLEESQIQSEALRAQEEEMRQNLEEISATQEEMSRKELEYLKIIEELNTNKKG